MTGVLRPAGLPMGLVYGDFLVVGTTYGCGDRLCRDGEDGPIAVSGRRISFFFAQMISSPSQLTFLFRGLVGLRRLCGGLGPRLE